MKIQPKHRDLLPGDDAIFVKDLTFDLAELKLVQTLLLDSLRTAAPQPAPGQPLPDTYRQNELARKLEYFISEFDAEE